jgi:hypothetical protein
VIQFHDIKQKWAIASSLRYYLFEFSISTVVGLHKSFSPFVRRKDMLYYTVGKAAILTKVPAHDKLD